MATAVTASPRTSTRSLVIASGCAVLWCVMQAPGKIIAETKLPIALNPTKFLGESLSLWDPLTYGGNTASHSVGYAFPMGFFSLIGHAVGIPTWCIQRLWMGLLLALACWGCARLLDACEIGTPQARLLGAVAYAANPFFLGHVGVLSAWVIGGAVLPMMLIPLVNATRGNPRWPPRRAALASAAMLGAIGGINPTVTIAAAFGPFIWILFSFGPKRWQVLRSWLVGVAISTAWWLIPTYLQGKYGYEFFAYTEQASRTTSTASTAEVLRGTADWLGYLNIRRVWLPAAEVINTQRIVVGLVTVWTMIGLIGLADRRLRHRRTLVAVLVTGCLAIGIGYGGAFGSPAAGWVQWFLDHPGRAFRNVYKFQPLVALPLTIGFVHCVARARQAAIGWFRPVAQWGAVLVAFGLAIPLFQGVVANRDGFTEVPQYWYEAAAFVNNGPSDGRVYIAPGSALPSYSWGFTLDEPAFALFDTPWTIRNQAPTGSEGATRLNDSIERIIENGGAPELPAVLERAGIDKVLVRNDLDWKRWFSPRPISVRMALDHSGLRRVASFGPTLAELGQYGDIGSDSERVLQAIDIYEVTTKDVRAQLLPTSNPIITSGSTEAVTSLVAGGLSQNSAVVVSGDVQPDQIDVLNDNARFAATDTYQRRYTEFGTDRWNDSYPLTQDESLPGGRPAQDYEAHDPSMQSLATLTGVRSVDASSYGSWLLQLPEFSPDHAIDGNPSTRWIAGNGDDSTGEWWEVTFEQPIELTTFLVDLVNDGGFRTFPKVIEVTTDAGTVSVPLQQGESRVLVSAPGRTGSLRITMAAIYEDGPLRPAVGIREVIIPGVTAQRSVTTAPIDLADMGEAGRVDQLDHIALQRTHGNGNDLLRSDAELELSRFVDVRSQVHLPLSARAVPRPGDELLGHVTSSPLSASASSTFGNLPSSMPSNLVDGDPSTFWLPSPVLDGSTDEYLLNGANPGTSTPTVTISWDTPATLTTVHLNPGAATPFEGIVSVEAGGVSQLATPDPQGFIKFSPVTTNSLTLRFSATAALPVSSEVSSLITGRLDLALAEITLPELNLAPSTLEMVHLDCGSGPYLMIDDKRFDFAVSATVESLRGLTPVALEPCGTAAVDLDRGRHHIESFSNGSGFAIERVDLGSLPTAAPVNRSWSIDQWDSGERKVTIESGPQAFLAINENANHGWTARLNGRMLRPVTLDGWKQGFVVPADQAGVIELAFASSGLMVGAFFGGLIAWLALIGWVRWGPAKLDPWRPPSSRAQSVRLDAALGVGVGFLLGGPLSAVGVGACMWLLRRKSWWSGWVIAPLVFLGLAMTLVHPGSPPHLSTGAFSPVTQLVTVVALGLAVAGDFRRGTFAAIKPNKLIRRTPQGFADPVNAARDSTEVRDSSDWALPHT